MSGQSKWGHFKAIHHRCQQTPEAMKETILDEFRWVCDYHRKHEKLGSVLLLL